MSVIRIEKNKNYSVVSNIPLNDFRLSWEASGMMAYLLSKPDDWQVRMTDLTKQRSAGRDKVKRIFKELETYGYLTRKRVGGAGGKFEWITTIHEIPTIDVFSIDGQTIDGKPVDILSTDLPNTRFLSCCAGDSAPKKDQKS